MIERTFLNAFSCVFCLSVKVHLFGPVDYLLLVIALDIFSEKNRTVVIANWIDNSLIMRFMVSPSFFKIKKR